ncbi:MULTISPECIES: CueP family metal-binding protein [Shewanella]|uniref:Uncharacterized protein n=1 Tax=Shewanella insulae TaxID=2681496 RepID=A0A6L7HU54_9GAMM|nr:CueP family metal-binding protein [Shewanella insulae]MXR67693.1 hypothetical protein [Shewanella insulae]
MLKLIFISSLLALGANSPAHSQTLIDAKSFKQLSYKEAVLEAHKLYKNNQGIMVKVLPNEVIASFADGTSATVGIPKDKFFLSIAPFLTNTHPCTNHVPTGCTGELVGEKMHMSAVDVNTGEEILNQMVTTQHDGFIDFWVPRNRELAFTFHYGDKNGIYREAKEVLSTYGNSRTCITTMQLSLNKTKQ